MSSHRVPPAVTTAIVAGSLLSCSSGDPEIANPTRDDGAPVRIQIDASGLQLSALGDTARLAAVVYDADGQDVSARVQVTWGSRAPEVASVDDGLVTANGNGTTPVFAETGGLSDTVPVSVEQVPVRMMAPEPEPSGVVGRTLPSPVTIVLLDGNDNPIPGQTVSFEARDGTIDPETTVTTADGLAQSFWTLGTLASVGQERQVLRAEAATDPSVTTEIRAFANADVPDAIAILTGDGESWIDGEETGVQVTVRVMDRYENGVPEELVDFDPRGDGRAEPPQVSTDSLGLAISEWFMQSPGFLSSRDDTLEVSVGGLGPVEVMGHVEARAILDTIAAVGDTITGAGGRQRWRR